MALSPHIIDELAARLDVAEKTRTQVGQFSLEHPEMTLEDGYAVSRAWVRHKLAEGRSVIGHKIGLTSRAMQRSSNVDEPDFGTLLDDMLFLDGHDIPMDHFIEPRVEVELAFILKQPLKGPGCTLYDVLNATDYVTPAIEIIDARIERMDKATGKTRKVYDTISDNAANAGLVLGSERHGVNDHDLGWVGAIVSRDGVVEETGLGAGVLNDPITSVLWLARRMAGYGQQIEAGDIVLSGSFIRPIEATPGSHITADFGPFGSVSVSFD